MFFRGREVLLYLSLLYQGEWEEIYHAIQEKQPLIKEEIEKVVQSFHTPYLTILDEDYPEAFKQVYRPPFVLFYYGDKTLLSRPGIAVIGSRNCSEYGKECTQKLVHEIVNDFVIISGFARGIDRIAHETAIDAHGKTIAILGTGIDYVYPLEQRDLYEKIKKKHLVLSEFPSFCEGKKEHFPFRNRLIAALGEGILVTEAKEKSGTNHTIRYGLEMGKDIFCVPYPLSMTSSMNRLIQEGAFLVEKGEDILKELKRK